MYVETSLFDNIGGVLSDIADKYQKPFEMTWYIANSKGNGVRVTNKPRYIRYFVCKVYAEHGYIVTMLFQNAKDMHTEMNKLDKSNDNETLNPNITEYGSGKFIRPLKKVGNIWYVQSNGSLRPINHSRHSQPGTIPDQFMPFIASRFIDTI